MLGARGGAGGGESAFHGDRVSGSEDEKLPEMGGGDNGAAMGTRLMPLNRTLKNGRSRTFYVYFTTIPKPLIPKLQA